MLQVIFLILPIEVICVPKLDFFHLDIHILNTYLEKNFVMPMFMQISLSFLNSLC